MRGCLICLLGLIFYLGSSDYHLGSLADIGPGFFPQVLAILMMLSGAAIGFNDWKSPGRQEIFPWAAVFSVAIPLLFFYWALPILGLSITTFLTAFSTLLLSKQASPMASTTISAGISALCVLIFYILLSIPLSL